VGAHHDAYVCTTTAQPLDTALPQRYHLSYIYDHGLPLCTYHILRRQLLPGWYARIRIATHTTTPTKRVAHRTRTAFRRARADRNRLAGKLAECYVEQWNDETCFNRAIALHSILHSNIPPRYADKSAEPPQRVRVPLYAEKRPSTPIQHAG